MAGSYSDVPGRRIAWDDDGTVGLYYLNQGDSGPPAGPWTPMDATLSADLNAEEYDDSSISITGGNNWFCFIFPELRDFKGWFGTMSSLDTGTAKLETSSDTTNGIDGTWTSRSTADALWSQSLSLDAYRTAIQTFAVSGIRAVRVRGGRNNAGSFWKRMHLYGSIASGQTPDRLLWIDDTTGLEFTADKDYGDVPRGSARDITVKLKNNSASLTANTIAWTREDLYLGSAAWYTFDYNADGVFNATKSLSSLGPGATSAAIRVRQDIADAATLGVHAARAYVTVASWT